MAPGIIKRHTKDCRSRAGGRCNCDGAWQAAVYSKRDGRKIRKHFTNAAEAKAWRADALRALDRGALRAPKPTTVREAWVAFYEGAKAGTVRNRAGDRYKPSTIRSYEKSMRLRVLPAFRTTRLSDVRRLDVQDFVDAMLATGLGSSTMQTALHPLRAIFRRALVRGDLAANPCSGLDLPSARGPRTRFASPAEAEALIAAAPEGDRAVWATAFYAGLRHGELRALRVEDVDLATGVIRVERGWDRDEGAIDLKSNAGRRKVPVIGALRDYLLEHLARTDRRGADLIFGTTPGTPFSANRLQKHADKAWRAANEREVAAGRAPQLQRITPHGCRHSFAAIMVAAGVNAKALQAFMGHASITVTLDTYGHLMPGSEAEGAGLVEAYLGAQQQRAEEAARGAGGLLAQAA